MQITLEHLKQLEDNVRYIPNFDTIFGIGKWTPEGSIYLSSRVRIALPTTEGPKGVVHIVVDPSVVQTMLLNDERVEPFNSLEYRISDKYLQARGVEGLGLKYMGGGESTINGKIIFHIIAREGALLINTGLIAHIRGNAEFLYTDKAINKTNKQHVSSI